MAIKQNLENEYKGYVEKNSDDYGKCCVDAGERFMKAVDEGKSFEEAENLAIKDTGMTGFMVGAMMSGICHFHDKGEEIKKWWNKRSGGEPDESGVNNPAIITI